MDETQKTQNGSPPRWNAEFGACPKQGGPKQGQKGSVSSEGGNVLSGRGLSVLSRDFCGGWGVSVHQSLLLWGSEGQSVVGTLVCIEWGESSLWGRSLSAVGRAREPTLPGQQPRTAHPASSERSTMNVVHTFFLKILGIQL